MIWWVEPEAYMCLCVCFCRKLSRARSPRPLKIKHWNMQCKRTTILFWNEIGGFWIGWFIVELWPDLRLVAHLDGCFRSPETVEEQAAYNGLLFNLVVPSVPQGRRWAKLNWDIQDVKGTRVCFPPQKTCQSAMIQITQSTWVTLWLNILHTSVLQETCQPL